MLKFLDTDFIITILTLLKETREFWQKTENHNKGPNRNYKNWEVTTRINSTIY